MDFNRDIIEELLMRLRVKALMGFKCVSKDWNNWISDGSFRSRYHSRQISKSNAPTGFICNHDEYFRGRDYITNEFLYLTNSENPVEKEELKSLGDLNNFGYVIASSKGLLLLKDTDSLVYVYDLVSKKHVKLQTDLEARDYYASFGFNCEENSDRLSYKVVYVATPCDTSYRTRASRYDVKVYSSESGTWQKSTIKAASNFAIMRDDVGKVIRGVFHWYDSYMDFIVAYDPEDPKGRAVLIKMPHTYVGPRHIRDLWRLTDFQGTKDGSLQMIIIDNECCPKGWPGPVDNDTVVMNVWHLKISDGRRSYMDEKEDNLIDDSRWSLVRSVRLWDISGDVGTREDRIIGIDPDDADVVYIEVMDQIYAFNHRQGKFVFAFHPRTSLLTIQYTHFEWPTWPCLL